MRGIFSFTIKASLALLLMSLIMVFIVDFATAEWYVSIMTAVITAVLLVISVIFLRKRDKEGRE